MQEARRLAHRSAITAHAPRVVPRQVDTHEAQTADARVYRFAIRLLMALAALAVVTVAIHVGGRFAGKALARGGHTTNTQTYSITIGDNLLAAPANMIRFKNQRYSGVQERLDLYFLFPSMTGYTNETRDWFNDLKTDDRQLVFVGIGERQMSRDMSGRFEPIYATITRPSGAAPEFGLESYEFLASAGYGNDTLLVGPAEDGKSRYVVRCLDGEDAAVALTACERDIHVGDNLSLTYRFPKSMLGEWRVLETNIRAFALGVMAPPAS
jgi:hypothetical protein